MPPERALLPIRRKSKSIRAQFRVVSQQGSQPVTPLGIRRHHFKQHLNHACLGVKTAWVGQLCCILLGDNRLDGVAAVPQTLMMGGQVPQIGNGVEPRGQHATIKPEGLGNGF